MSRQKLTGFERRRQRVRTSLRKRAAGKLRLSIHRSGKHMYAQLIDDAKSATVVSASTLDKDIGDVKSSTVAAATKVGELIAQRAKKAKVDAVVFDRGGFIFHGRVKAVAEGARAGGLKF